MQAPRAPSPQALDAEEIKAALGAELVLPCGQRVKNRLLKSAMSETLAPANNRVTGKMATLYGRWADGGIGLSVTGNVMIDRRARGEPGNVCIEDEQDLDSTRNWAQAGKRKGSLIYMQLNHPGRQVPKFLNHESVAPSAVPFSRAMQPMFATPRALTDTEVPEIIERFATTAAIAQKAGFDGVQIHGAHGYLVSQFLSPLTNLREDDWGGSPEKRRRFALEVYRAIRARTGPHFGISIKINSADFQKGGITPEASTETICALAQAGMDLIEISGGTYEAPAMMSSRDSTRKREAYFFEFAAAVRKQLKVPLVLTGGFRSGAGMADAIRSGAVDMVGLARTLAVNPDFPNELIQRGDVRVDLRPRKLGIDFVDKKAMLELTWYERQLHRMGAGEEPVPEEGPWRSLLGYAWTHGPKAFKTRRGG